MSRKIELFHAGSWTSSQVVRLIRTLVCPSCDVVDVDLDAAPEPGASQRERMQPHVRVLGRTVWLEDPLPASGPAEPAEPATRSAAHMARRPR